MKPVVDCSSFATALAVDMAALILGHAELTGYAHTGNAARGFDPTNKTIQKGMIYD